MRSRMTWPPVMCWMILVGSIILSGCQARERKLIAPIVAPYQPFRIVQFCIDTPPLFPAALFRKAANAVADRIDASAQVNSGGMEVFVSRISSNSLGDNPLSFAVPAIPADDLNKPTLPPHTGDYSQAGWQKRYEQAVAGWQNQLSANHRLRDQVLVQTRQYTDQLRHLADPYDAKASDLLGCLDLASRHLEQKPAQRWLIIASDLVNNTLLQKVDDLSLRGVNVEVVWRPCAVAASCEASDAGWAKLWRHLGAQSVVVRDPAESDVVGVQF